MRAIIIILLTIVCSQGAYSQQELPTFNLFDKADYTIKAYKYDKELKFKYVMTKSGEEPKEEKFTLETNTLAVFQNKFAEIMESFDPSFEKDRDRVKAEANRMFYIYVASSKAIGDLKGPLAGELTLRREVTIHRALDPGMVSYLRKKGNELRKENTLVTESEKSYTSNLVKKSDIISKGYLEGGDDDTTKIKLWQGAIKKREVKHAYIRFVENHIKDSLEKKYRKKEKGFCTYIDSVRIFKQKLAFVKIDIAHKDSLLGKKNIQKIKLKKTNLELKLDSLNLITTIRNRCDKNMTIDSIKKKTEAKKDSLINKLILDKELTLPAGDKTTQEKKQIDKVLLKLNKQVVAHDSVTEKDTLRKEAFQNIQVEENAEKGQDGAYEPNTKSILEKLLKEKLKEDSVKIKEIERGQQLLEEYLNQIEDLRINRDSIDALEKLLKALQEEAGKDLINKRAYDDSIKTCLNSIKTITDSLIILSRQLPSSTFRLEAAQLEFKDGFIENMRVTGVKYLEHQNVCGLSKDDLEKYYPLPQEIKLKFDNYFPLGFSREQDFNELVAGDQPRLVAYTENPQKRRGDIYYVPTSQIFENYVQEHKVGRRDFSPKNDVVDFEFSKEGNATESEKLYKIERKKLFEAKIFADFLGLKEGNENGLIQTEVSKQLNINTKRKSFSKYKFSHITNLGSVAYVKPIVTFSKIESNNRSLLIDYRDRITNNQYSPLKFVTTLDLKSYENFSTGLDANIGLLDLPLVKSTFFLDIGFRYGRVSLSDSLRSLVDGAVVKSGDVREVKVDTYTLTPLLLTWKLQTDERYAFDFNWSWNQTFLRNNDILQVANKETFLQDGDNSSNTGKERTYFRVELNAQYNSADNAGKLFFRYRYYWQNKFWNTGFSQIQVGYSFFITAALSK